jgi:hypothetical protein
MVIIIMMMIIIIIIIISCMQGIRTYIPETQHVSRVYVQCRSYSAHTVNGAYNAVFNINLFCASTLTLLEVCALCPV